MQTKTNPIPASGRLPDDYQEVLFWTVTGKPLRVLILNILGGVLFIVFGGIFFSLAISLGKLPTGNFRIGWVEMSLGIAGVLLTLVLHELTHGFAMRMVGARPRYGIYWKGLMLYATSPGYAFHRNAYVVITLAPFVLLSLLVVLGMWGLQGTLWVALLGVCGTVNASGAIGDLWITTIVLRYARIAEVVDERDGIRIFLPKP